MKFAILLIVMLSVTSCGSLFYKRIADRKEDCVERFIKLDVDGVDASKICSEVHKRK